MSAKRPAVATAAHVVHSREAMTTNEGPTAVGAAAPRGLDDAWGRVEAAMRRTPYAYIVRVNPGVGPAPYRTGVAMTYQPEGRKRRRTDEVRGEGMTLAEALNALADGLEEWRPRP